MSERGADYDGDLEVSKGKGKGKAKEEEMPRRGQSEYSGQVIGYWEDRECQENFVF